MDAMTLAQNKTFLQYKENGYELVRWENQEVIMKHKRRAKDTILGEKEAISILPNGRAVVFDEYED